MRIVKDGTPIARSESSAPGEHGTPVAHRGNRHGRSEAAREAVLNAADNLLVETGFAALTIEGIAARSNVAKQTIYRWWSSKTDILMDAFLEDVEEELSLPDHGNLRADLRAYVALMAEFLTKSDAGAVFRALIGQAQNDPRLAARLREAFVAKQRAHDIVLFRRAQERGELSEKLDVYAALDRLLGPLYYRAIVTGEGMPPSFTDELVDAFVMTLHLA